VSYREKFALINGFAVAARTMKGPSDDWFIAPTESGIDLLKNGNAVRSDIMSPSSLLEPR
jgi:hypothetical protein